MNFLKTLGCLSQSLLILFVGLSLSNAYAAPPAKAFGELPVSLDADISPDGQRIAVILNNNGEYGVYTARLKGEDKEGVLTPLDRDLNPLYVRWVNKNQFAVSFQRNDRVFGTPVVTGHLYVDDVTDSKDGRRIFKDIVRQDNNTVVDWLETDPDHILMAYSKDIFDPYPSIYRVNLKTFKHTQVQRFKVGVERWKTDNSGVPRIGQGKTKNGIKKFLLFNQETKNWDSYEDYPGLKADTPIFGFLKNGTELIIGDYNDRDTLGIYAYDLNKRRITRKVFHHDNYDANSVLIDQDEEKILGVRYIADEVETELFDESATVLKEMMSKYPDYSVNFLDQTEDRSTIVVKMSHASDPGGVFLYSRKDGALKLVGPTYNILHKDDMGDVIPVKYTARDGEKISAYVTVPKAVETQEDFKNLPFIVLPHGGPYGRDYKRFDYFAQFFATRGYGVMQMNFRGSDGFGKSFENAGRSNWIVMQEDVEDATKYLFKKGYADPNRTCIAGWSYGGYAALMGGAKDTEQRYSCVIAMAALTDIKDAKRDLKKYRSGKFAADDFFGEAMKDSDIRKANTPVERADDIKVPVFLAHGDNDANVHFDQFKRMKKALKKAGADGTYLAFEDEDHFLSRQENREEFFIELEKFLKKANGTSEFMAK